MARQVIVCVKKYKSLRSGDYPLVIVLLIVPSFLNYYFCVKKFWELGEMSISIKVFSSEGLKGYVIGRLISVTTRNDVCPNPPPKEHSNYWSDISFFYFGGGRRREGVLKQPETCMQQLP